MSKDLSNFIEAVHNTDQVSGLTHNFYRYPARFSPIFAREAINAFTNPGQVVLDLFVGGGTTLVEASYLGRKSYGVDISGLATFISNVKTTPLDQTTINFIREWLNVNEQFTLQSDRKRPKSWIEEGYQKNINSTVTWRLRNIIEAILWEVEKIPNNAISDFLRCCLLKTGQWALDGRKKIPSVEEFRSRLHENILNMVDGISIYSEQVTKNQNRGLLWGDGSAAKVLNISAEKINEVEHLKQNPPSLILMSPPYPGIHVLYHRWQVQGRRETPAPFWIANRTDGNGASQYTFGDRKAKDNTEYFQEMEKVFYSLSQIVNKSTNIVQVMAFSDPCKQLPRYLRIMEVSGFEEIFVKETQTRKRLWRTVPNRKWYADQRGTTAGSKEVVLIHTKK